MRQGAQVSNHADLARSRIPRSPAMSTKEWSPMLTTFRRWRACDNVSTEANDDGVAKSASAVGFVPERGASAASLI
jgi:hypothetical protein